MTGIDELVHMHMFTCGEGQDDDYIQEDIYVLIDPN